MAPQRHAASFPAKIDEEPKSNKAPNPTFYSQQQQIDAAASSRRYHVTHLQQASESATERDNGAR